MLKPVTLSVSLAIALGASGMVLAGHHKAMPSPQGPVASEQCVTPSPQGEVCGDICGDVCAPKKRCCLADLCKALKPKPKCYTYTWVLKKKRCGGGLFGGLCGHHDECGDAACDSCGDVWPSPQGIASPQGYSSPQGYGSPQHYGAPVHGAGQAYGAGQSYGAGQANGAGQAYGAGQIGGAGQSYGAGQIGGVGQAAPAGGDEPPPAPEGDMAPPPPAAPEAPPAPPAPGGPSASLLFLAPAGN